jgi:hypothetical protein
MLFTDLVQYNFDIKLKMPTQKVRRKYCVRSYGGRDSLAFQQMSLKGKHTVLN